MLNCHSISGIKLIMVDGLFDMCLYLVCKYLIENFAFMFMRDIGLSLLFYFYLVLVLKHTDFVGRVWKRSVCFIFFSIGMNVADEGGEP